MNLNVEVSPSLSFLTFRINAHVTLFPLGRVASLSHRSHWACVTLGRTYYDSTAQVSWLEPANVKCKRITANNNIPDVISNDRETQAIDE